MKKTMLLLAITSAVGLTACEDKVPTATSTNTNQAAMETQTATTSVTDRPIQAPQPKAAGHF